MNRDTATQMIESLRAGIPTRVTTRYLTSTRNHLHEQFEQDLSQLANRQSIPKGRLIWGQYGQGKTHELTCLEHMALEQGFAVSRITLNRQLSGQRLDHLYSKLATSIRTPESKLLGIRHFLDRKNSADLFNTPIQDVDRYCHSLLPIILETYFRASAEEQELLYSVLVGAPIPMAEIRRIYKRSLGITFPKLAGSFVRSKHSQAYFELMADILTWCGLRGWVILIDEIELIARLPKLRRMQAYHHLYWLMNGSGEQTFPIYMVGGVAQSLMDLWCHPQGRNQPPDATLIPELARARNNGYSEGEMIAFFKYAQNQEHCPFIEPIKRHQLVELLTEIAKIHGISYGWEPQINVDRVIDALGNNPLRTHIRGLLETLDMAYLGDNDFLPQATFLTESSIQEDATYFTEEDGDGHQV